MAGDDDLLFADEPSLADAATPTARRPWRVLLVDDEPAIHSVTRLALSRLEFRGRGLEFYSAMSGAQAIAMMAELSDVALVFMDVVMENDQAGLLAVRHIREQLGNRFARIILRTGQPGQHPERDVILNYDINDYKNKSDLTADRLFTTVITALRAYDDIMALESSRSGLERIIQSILALQVEEQTLERLAAGVLLQLTGLLGMGPSAVLVASFPHAHLDKNRVLAAAGAFDGAAGDTAGANLPAPLLARLQAAASAGKSEFTEQDAIVQAPGGCLYLSGRLANPADHILAKEFVSNVAAAFGKQGIN